MQGCLKTTVKVLGPGPAEKGFTLCVLCRQILQDIGHDPKQRPNPIVDLRGEAVLFFGPRTPHFGMRNLGFGSYNLCLKPSALNLGVVCL